MNGNENSEYIIFFWIKNLKRSNSGIYFIYERKTISLHKLYFSNFINNILF